MSFVHLHNHTHYSLLDGLTKIDEMVNFAKEQGSPAIAITDHGALYGAIEFYQKAKKAGIKPIIGVEAYLAKGSRLDKSGREDANNYHLVLLAKNQTGYKNLIKLVSIAHLEGFYYKPRIDWELLSKHSEGLIALSACIGGEIPRLIIENKLEEAKKRILEYKELFGAGNYYLELQDHPELPDLEKVNQQLILFSKELDVPLVATNDVHYFKKEDAEAQDILLCIHSKKKLNDTDRFSMMGMGDYSLRSNADMINAFKNVPEAIENTLKIAEACNLEIELGNTTLPHFEVPAGHDGNSYLKEWCQREIETRYPQADQGKLKTVNERLEYELSVITRMDWPSYFLIVADFINWAKDQGIVVGPGRGSAAGSIVCYLLNITNIDPLKYDLIFERFLNPDRISMPDIDIDFADDRRNEVLRYVEEKYGHDHVAQIITFGTLAARAAVRDVGRVLDAPYSYCDRISKSIPMFTKLADAIKSVPEVREMYQNEPLARKILDFALRLEGVARHTSTHACGVLITDKPLTEYVPIQKASSVDETIISQYSLHPIEDLGLLKMDFLGLKNLSTIESALKIIKNTRGLEIDIDEIPLDDAKTYDLFQKGNTTGVFQFESSGMRRYLRQLKPSVFEDIIAMVALYRPGPMEWIPDYISGKHKLKKVSYLHPKLESILEKTYGVAIYQEQIMQIAQELAGFTMAQADVLRKAVGKKIPTLLAEQKEKFIEGCVQNGIYKELAEKVFSFIEPFAGYGFNRSHAACYALIGYQTAYLKAHWPVEFMAALLTADQGDLDRISIILEESQKMDIKIMSPDINESFASFTVVSPSTKDNKSVDVNAHLDTIRFGLRAIKNVGEHIIEELIEERKKAGPYKDVFDFLNRIVDKDLNRKSLESLIKGGALDSFAERGLLLTNLEKLLSYNREMVMNKNSQQGSLFSGLQEEQDYRPSLDEAIPVGQMEKLSWEKELLGFYISEHPFNLFKEYIEGYALNIGKALSSNPNNTIITAGIVTDIKKIITRKGDSMAFVKIEDNTMSVEILIFPQLYKKSIEVWEIGRAVILAGKLSDKDGDLKILADQVGILNIDKPLESVAEFKKSYQIKPNGFKSNGFRPYGQNNYSNNYQSQVKDNKKTEPDPKTLAEANNKENNFQADNPLLLALNSDLNNSTLLNLKSILSNYPGDNQVYFRVIENNKYKVVKTSYTVNNNEELRSEIKNKLSSSLKIFA